LFLVLRENWNFSSHRSKPQLFLWRL
jgi:hypothetical protein